MSNLWKEMKEKRKDKRIKKVGEKGLHYLQENENLERHIANLQGENTLKEKKASEQLENEARQLYMLLPGQETQWYHIITERVETIQNKSVTEILSALLPHIVQHPEIEKRLRKQLKKSQEKTFDGTIKQCLNKIMKGYKSPEGLPARKQNLANFEKAKELTSTSRDNDNSLLISGNVAIASDTNSPESIRKTDRPIKKRCHFCKKKGHIIKNCPKKKMCKEWLKNNKMSSH